jgi:hypothetical protein
MGKIAGVAGEALIASDIINSTAKAFGQVESGDYAGAGYTMSTLSGRVEGGLYGAELAGEAGAELGSLFGPVGAAAGGLLAGIAGAITGYELGENGVDAIWNAAAKSLSDFESWWNGDSGAGNGAYRCPCWGRCLRGSVFHFWTSRNSLEQSRLSRRTPLSASVAATNRSPAAAMISMSIQRRVETTPFSRMAGNPASSFPTLELAMLRSSAQLVVAIW